jgi:hypothetical protein
MAIFTLCRDEAASHRGSSGNLRRLSPKMLQRATNWRPRPRILELLSSDALRKHGITKRNA